MSRRTKHEKRDVLPDPVYNSKLVTRLINRVMFDGKRGTAQTIIYHAFSKIEEKTGKSAMDVFATAISNIMPEVELKVRRIGAAGSSLILAFATRRPWKTSSPTKSSMPPMAPALLSRRSRMSTRWPKPTRLTPTSAGN